MSTTLLALIIGFAVFLTLFVVFWVTDHDILRLLCGIGALLMVVVTPATTLFLLSEHSEHSDARAERQVAAAVAQRYGVHIDSSQLTYMPVSRGDGTDSLPIQVHGKYQNCTITLLGTPAAPVVVCEGGQELPRIDQR